MAHTQTHALLKDRHYSVEEYLACPEDTPRCELIDGVVYNMNAPSLEHQRLLAGLHYELEHHQRERIKNGDDDSSPCQILFAPVDVIISDLSVVQPDLIVLCNPAILVNGKVRGAPDLVVEILSPSTAVKDKRQKLRLYEVAGVPQYLVIDPANFLAECYQLGADGHYSAPEVMGAGDTLTLQVTPGFTLTLSAIFGWPLPLVAEELSAHYG